MQRTFDFEIDGTPDQSFRIVLDSVTYEVRFQWNERDESWLFMIGDVGTDPTVTMKLTVMTDLLAPYRYMDNIPQGNLYLLPARTDITVRAGRYNIGVLTDIEMSYASLDEDVQEIE